MPALVADRATLRSEFLKIEYQPSARLPMLAWCAHARAGAPVRVRHGAGVETRDYGFAEGAWDGDFDAFDFDRAGSFAGSGARIRDAALVFAAPFHPLERLFVLRKDAQVWISNSLVFLLTEAGDALDLSHPHYFFDLVAQVRRGIAPPATRLATAAGNWVELYPCCNLELRADATLRRLERPLGAPPGCYADYLDLLLGTTRRLAANAVRAAAARPSGWWRHAPPATTPPRARRSPAGPAAVRA